MKADDPVVKNILVDKPEGVYTIKDLKEKGNYMAYSSEVTFMTGDKWHLVSAIPESVILRTYHSNQFKTLVIIAISLVFICLLIVVIAKSINQPIQKLMRIMKKVEDGDLTESSEVDSLDEIGQLSRSFDKMLDSLRHLINEVQTTSTVVENSSEHLSDLALQNAESIGEVNKIVSQIAEANVRQAEDIESIVKPNSTARLQNQRKPVRSSKSSTQMRFILTKISNQGVSTLSNLDEKSNETRALSEAISKAVYRR